MNLLYIDLFCGAGGVTTGIQQVPGVHVVACVNHDPDAIASHAANHPKTMHYTEDIRTLDTAPMVSRLETMRSRYPWAKTVLWASCECTNFSRAKGGKPRDPDSRSLAEHLYRYIDALTPDYIQVENVTEFLDWGPIIERDGKLMPCPERKGVSFHAWFSYIESMGYSGEWRVFNAADFGAYTSRKRLFIQFVRTGLTMAWPEPTNTRKNWKPCRDVLDLEDWGKSIFERKKPLCDATLRRLAEGVKKFATPQFVSRYMSGSGHVHSLGFPCVTVCTQKNLYLATSRFLSRYFSGNGHNTSIHEPCGTLTTVPHQYPVTVKFIDNYFGRGYPTSLNDPIGTLCTKEQRFPVTCQFLDQQFGRSKPSSLDGVFPSVMTNQHYGVVSASCIKEKIYNYPKEGDTEAMLELKALMRKRCIADIFMRPISIKESLRVMGFSENYKLVGNQTQQRKFIGNAVEVNMARCMAQAISDSLSGAVEIHGDQMKFEFREEAS